MQNINPITILFSIIGLLFIFLALLNKQLLRRIGIKPMSEVFTNPNFQRSAKITENLGRWLFAVLGAGFLIQGIGTQFLSSGAAYTVSLIISGSAGLIILCMFGVVLVHWKAK